MTAVSADDQGSDVGRFPGFSEDAPLDLSNLSAAAEAGIVRRLIDKSHAAWSEAAAGVGYCAHPIRLTGSSQTIDAATGEVLSTFSSTDAPLGVVYRACGNRRADICPACSRTYARDTFAMIKSGISGGKTIPETVADNPLLFLTLTAPSFGYVHGARAKNGQPSGGRCRPRDRVKVCDHGRPVGCMAVHDHDDSVVGSPLCPDCYDWDSAVVWQWWAPELWRRTTIALKRAVAAELEVSEYRLGRVASVQFAKVAEYQTRGLVHFHALVRLDGSDGPGSPAPLSGDRLAVLVDRAARSVTFTAPGVDAEDHDRLLAWGAQLDVRVVRDRARADSLDGSLTAEQVAGYLAKYATKDASSLRTVDHRLLPHSDRIARTCRALADRAHQDDHAGSPYRLLGKWAHMLGFRGHFSSKSRRYSITLGRLRRARHRYRQMAAEASRAGRPLDVRDLEARLLAEDDETTLVVGDWWFQGVGWTNDGDRELALAAAARAREYDQWKAEQRRK